MKPARTASLNQIKLQERIITYKSIVSKRARYLRLQINNSNELEVIIPSRGSFKHVEDFILQKREWILKHLKEEKKPVFLFLGKEIDFLINYDLFLKKAILQFSGNKLIAGIPSGNDSFTKEDIFNIWLKHKAKGYIPQRVKELSHKHGFYPKKITIRSQKTRWGSCSARGSLSFNYKLIKFRKEVIDYVIIHELCHIKELNHSIRFWKLVAGFCPGYIDLKRELRSK